MDVFEVSGCAGSEAAARVRSPRIAVLREALQVMLEMTIGVKSKKTKTALRSKESDEDPTTPGRFTFQGILAPS